MRGALSAAPAPCAIRLLVGSHLLFLVQAGIVLTSAPRSCFIVEMLVLMTAMIGVAALVTAILGEPATPSPGTKGRNRHGR